MTIIRNPSYAEEITQNTFFKAMTAKKQLFQLRVFGELSFSQIGVIFKKTENWARVTYHRARLKIQERMVENE